MFDATAAGYALLLGMVAAFNPCGFALLPAYITVLVTGSAEEGVSRGVAVRRALMFGLAMTAGFMAIFTAFGLLFGAVSLGLQGSVLPYVSYFTVVLGFLLVWLGVVLLRGGALKGPGLSIGSKAPSTTFWSQTLYGASFAIASLSCTIGLFLVIVAQALSATNPVGAVAPFAIYGVGMGTSIVVVSLLAALAGSGIASSLRKRTPMLMRVGGALMILAGFYVVVFGLSEILPTYGIDVLNPVLLATAQWQGAVAMWIQQWNAGVLAAIVAVVAVIAAGLLITTRRSAEASVPVAPDKDSHKPSSHVPTAAPDTLKAVRDSVKRSR